MTKEQYNFLMRAKERMNLCRLDDEKKRIFTAVALRYQAYAYGTADSKFVSKAELCKKFGFSDDRRLRAIMRELLELGLPVCSSSRFKGYFLADSIDEVLYLQRENKRRALNIMKLHKAYNSVLELVGGQPTIFDELKTDGEINE